MREHFDVGDPSRDLRPQCVRLGGHRRGRSGTFTRCADFAESTLLDFLLSARPISPDVRDALTTESVGLTSLARGAKTRIDGRRHRTPISASSCCSLRSPVDPRWTRVPRATSLRRRSSIATDVGRTRECVYEAIRLANPGGLGDAPEQDVQRRADGHAARSDEARGRPRHGRAAVRQRLRRRVRLRRAGVPRRRSSGSGASRRPSSTRNCGGSRSTPIRSSPARTARPSRRTSQRRARKCSRLGGIATPEGRRAGVALDRHLRSDGNKLNPGTTADLITACLFVALRENKVAPSAPFRWDVPDWL